MLVNSPFKGVNNQQNINYSTNFSYFPLAVQLLAKVYITSNAASIKVFLYIFFKNILFVDIDMSNKTSQQTPTTTVLTFDYCNSTWFYIVLQS